MKVVANWKMNGTRHSLHDLTLTLLRENTLINSASDVVLCPPFPFLCEISQLLAEEESVFQLGGQDCSALSAGACTGEVSALMLREYGCTHVIIGHSERRLAHQEQPPLLARKIKQAFNQGLTPILCIGEDAEERGQGRALRTVVQQVALSLEEIDLDQGSLVLAYEPLWAIGTGNVPSSKDIEEVHGALNSRWPTLPILYGGSVSAKNVPTIYGCDHVAGVLVGGASLKAEEFLEIIHLAG